MNTRRDHYHIFKQGHTMDIKAIQKKAGSLGITDDAAKDMTKAQLVAAIQAAEGNSPCYASKTSDCPHTACCWMSDCYAEARLMDARKKSPQKKNVAAR